MVTEQLVITERGSCSWFDFDKMVEFLKKAGYGSDSFVKFLHETQKTHDEGCVVKDHFDIEKRMLDCLYYECAKMWVRHDDRIDFDGKWYDDPSNYIHYGVSGNFLTGEEVRFYYKVTHSEANPFSAQEVKYCVGCVDMMLINDCEKPLKPWELTLRQRINSRTSYSALLALNDPDCDEIYDEEESRNKGWGPLFYRIH